MPSGVEVVYGVRGDKAINAFLAKIGVKVISFKGDGPWEWRDKAKLPSLRDAHAACLREFFSSVENSKSGDYIRAATPAGPREFAPFSFELYYDPGEMDDEPEHAIFGVGFSGRYVPTYLDWRSPHGCIEHVKLDPHTMQMIDKAKAEICKIWPQAEEDFAVQFMEVWY